MNWTFILTILGGLLFITPLAQKSVGPEPAATIEKCLELSSIALNSYDYENSIKYSLKLIELASESEDHFHLYHAYNNLGITYEDRKDTARAKDNYLKALESAVASKNDTILWWAYNNLGSIYSWKEETVELAFDYYDKAIDVVKRLEDSADLLTPMINKGWVHLDYDQYSRAFPYLREASQLLQGKDDERTKTQLQILFGRYYSGIGDYEKAKLAFDTALEVVERDSLVVDASNAYKAYAEMLFANEEFIDAYVALEKHLEYEGKIFEQEKLHQMEAAYTRYETEEYRKSLEAAEQEQEFKDEVIERTRQMSVILGISIFIMMVFLILLLRSNRLRNKLISELKCKNNELTLAKEEAERLSSLKTRFFSTVSHELRTPLYGVVGLTDLLLEDNKDEKKEQDLKSLKFSADYLLALINDVLQMNKMEAKLLQLEKLPFNVEELLQGIVKSFEFTRIQNQNVVDLQIDPSIPRNLVGDSVRLSQIIMNLVGNAVKFTERGKVWIKAGCKDCDSDTCRISFEVGDTGMGIPENKQKEIFKEFSQLEANNYNYQGTGLGLSIVEKLLDLFGSRIELQSEEGKGSVFRFEILFKKGEVSTQESLQPEGEDFFQEETRKALIVDDNRINQIVTQRILEKRNFKCEIANDGFEAIEKIKAEAFDVVLMDVNMPGMSGMETTEKIRSFNKNIPVIALTAVEVDEMREEILKSGMNDIIVKPYDSHQFFNTVFRNLLVEIS